MPVCLRNSYSEAYIVVVELALKEERFLFGFLTKDHERTCEEVAGIYPILCGSEFVSVQ